MSDWLLVWLAVLVAVLSELVLHWFPWRLLLRRDLPRLVAYTLGTLGLALPLTGLYLYWEVAAPATTLWYVRGLWAVIAGGGLAVSVAWGIDWLMVRVARSWECEEREVRCGQAAGSEVVRGTGEPGDCAGFGG